MKAWLNLRPGVHYRREAFAAGLESCGYAVQMQLPTKPEGVLVVWNRYAENAYWADRFEAAGLPVLVAENGYLGNDFAGARWYAIARNHHNGAGSWSPGGPERWDALGVTLAPWKEAGGDVVLLPQRGIGPAGVAMARDWERLTASKLKARGIALRIRPHPGINPCRDLADDLSNASAVVTWGSGAALKAMAMGVPVYSDFRRWIGAPSAAPVDALGMGLRPCDDAARLAVFRSVAWAQWRLEEIASGQAFKHLLAR